MGLHIRETHTEVFERTSVMQSLLWLSLTNVCSCGSSCQSGGAQGKPLPSVAPRAGGLDNDVA